MFRNLLLKRLFFAVLVIIAILVIALVSLNSQRSEKFDQISNMKLESSAFEHNQSIPAKYTCDGENINPPLKISDVPEGTQSLVLIMDDPDAPMGVWDHWLVWNIPVKTSEIPEGQEPQGVIGKNTGGKLGYQGPCPPDREHRYFFKLYALDATLDLSPGTTSKKDLEKAMEGHILGQTELMGRYARR